MIQINTFHAHTDHLPFKIRLSRAIAHSRQDKFHPDGEVARDLLHLLVGCPCPFVHVQHSKIVPQQPAKLFSISGGLVEMLR